MNLTGIEENGALCVLVESDEPVITDAQSAIDLLTSAQYDVGSKDIVIPKQLVAEDFFVLSTGLAGEVLQKYVNYGGRMAIYGDYSHYTSKPLKDFMYESNKAGISSSSPRETRPLPRSRRAADRERKAGLTQRQGHRIRAAWRPR